MAIGKVKVPRDSFEQWWDKTYDPEDQFGRRKRTWMSSCSDVMKDAAQEAWKASSRELKKNPR